MRPPAKVAAPEVGQFCWPVSSDTQSVGGAELVEDAARIGWPAQDGARLPRQACDSQISTHWRPLIDSSLGWPPTGRLESRLSLALGAQSVMVICWPFWRPSRMTWPRRLAAANTRPMGAHSSGLFMVCSGGRAERPANQPASLMTLIESARIAGWLLRNQAAAPRARDIAQRNATRGDLIGSVRFGPGRRRQTDFYETRACSALDQKRA